MRVFVEHTQECLIHSTHIQEALNRSKVRKWWFVPLKLCNGVIRGQI